MDTCMKSYAVSKPLYLKTDTSGVVLGARLLQIRDGMNCGCDKAPGNTTLRPIASANKSLSSAKWNYRNIE